MKSEKGHTLVEIMMVIITIGIIVAMSIPAIRGVQYSYTSLTYFAHRHVVDMIRAFMSANNLTTLSGYTDMTLCTNVADYVNIAGAKTCGNANGVTAPTTAATEPKFNANPTSVGFNHINGMRFYFSQRQNANTNIVSGKYWWLVGVDLNGANKKPNSITVANGRPADIVTFLVLDNGEVYPLDVAADNLALSSRTIYYLNARGLGFTYSNFKSPTQIGTTRSYREAFCKTNVANTANYSYLNYCSMKGYAVDSKCNPSTSGKYDLCAVQIVKPAFRYNM